MPTFAPSSRDSDNRGASTSRLINCYRQPVANGGRTTHTLKSVLGTEAFSDLGNVFFYGAGEHESALYTALGGRLYRTAPSGTSDDLGAISAGQTDISGNGSAVTLAAGQNYFVLSGGALTTPSAGPFSAIGSVAFLDQYTLYTEFNGRRAAWSALGDPGTLPALNFLTAESTDSDIVRGVVVNGRWVIFNRDSRAVYFNTGDSGANAFLRLAGGVRNTGLKGFYLLTEADEGLFFVGDDNIARFTFDGLEERKFSYPPVDTAIAQGQPTECFYNEDEGQKVCTIRFADRPSWSLDLATGEWHERAEGGDQTAWSIRDIRKVGDLTLGVTNEGQVRKLLRNNADVDSALRRTAVSQTFYAEDGASLDELEIYARTGFHNLGRDAQMWIRLSRDGGHTWTKEKWRTLGGKGDYRNKAVWKSQGYFEELTIEANISEPDEVPLWSEYRMEAA